MGALLRQRQSPDLPLLSEVRLHRLLGGTSFPGLVAVAIGTFADPNFPAPTVSVWEECRHPWVSPPTDPSTKRVAKQG